MGDGGTQAGPPKSALDESDMPTGLASKMRLVQGARSSWRIDMLAFSRTREQEAIITTPEGRVIRLAVLAIKPGKVVLGFKADVDVIIDRLEVHQSRTGEALVPMCAKAA